MDGVPVALWAPGAPLAAPRGEGAKLRFRCNLNLDRPSPCDPAWFTLGNGPFRGDHPSCPIRARGPTWLLGVSMTVGLARCAGGPGIARRAMLLAGFLLACSSPKVTDPPTGLRYPTNPAVYTVGTPIEPNSPTIGGGPVASYSVSPPLPAGLVLNSSTGVISGTPSAVTATAIYGVTANNAAGSTTGNLSITVVPQPPVDLRYSTNPAVYPDNTAIAPNIPSSSGGAVDSYSVSPPLPLYLALDPSTGVITGAPQMGPPVASPYYTVTASNSGGSTTATLSITIVIQAPSGLTYSTNPAVYNVGTPITPNTPGGILPAASFSVSPPLPAGLVFDPLRGVISGTPAAVTATATYFVTASNSTGSTSASLSITVLARNNPVTARIYHTATLLPSGDVLVAGGNAPGTTVSLASAELYHADSGTFEATGSMAAARSYHTATPLPGGRVLFAGGYVGTSLASAETYEPATGTFTSTGSMTVARYGHTATLLPNGKVLIVSGSTAELYDPVLGTFQSTGSMATDRAYFTATLLPSGTVLVVGGDDNFGASIASAEVYDPALGTFQGTGSLAAGRALHTATRLPDGMVLLTGGCSVGAPCGTIFAAAELYDPVAGTFVPTGSLATARVRHTATLLSSGKVLVAGGLYLFNRNSAFPTPTAELYDPTKGIFTSTGSMTVARYGHTATLLPNGKVLIVSGSTAELYDPLTGTFSLNQVVP